MQHVSISQPPTSGYIPVDLFPHRSQLVIRWHYVGNTHFTAPFLKQELRTQKKEGQNQHLLTSFTVLEKIPMASPPAAFIFHHSRCGSTLMSRILGAPQGHCSISEPEVMGKLIQYQKWLSIPIETAIMQLINALVSRGGGYQARTFIKWSSWCVLFAKEITSCFNDVPCLFLFRDPLPALISQIARPASWTHSESTLSLIHDKRSSGEPFEAFIARNMARFMQAGLHFCPRHLVHYENLKAFVLQELPGLLRLKWSRDARDAILEVTRWDAHRPERKYSPRPNPPSSIDHKALQQAHARYTRAPYQELLKASQIKSLPANNP